MSYSTMEDLTKGGQLCDKGYNAITWEEGGGILNVVLLRDFQGM